MTVTEHPGFLSALSSADLTSTQIEAITRATLFFEGSFAAAARYVTAGRPDRSPELPAQERGPTSSGRSEDVQSAFSDFGTLRAPIAGPSFNPSHSAMTATEIMCAQRASVESGTQPEGVAQ